MNIIDTRAYEECRKMINSAADFQQDRISPGEGDVGINPEIILNYI